MVKKSETLADKTLDEKAPQKPEPKLEAATLLGKIFTLMKKKREQDLKYRIQEKRNKSESQLQEIQMNTKILESVKESKDETKSKKQDKTKKEPQKKKKGLLDSFTYPGGISGFLVDVGIVSTLIIKHNQDAEKIQKDFDDLVEDDLLEKLKSFDYTGEEKKLPKTESPNVPAPQPPTTGAAPTTAPAAPSAPAGTATKTPQEQSAPTTATKIPKGAERYGYLSASGLSAVISTHEGNATSVYGDYKDKSGKTVNKFGDTPEDWSQKTLGSRKKLTEFTFAELLQYQKYRLNASGKSTGAVGIAGFMPSTIFGRELNGKNGLFSQSGLSWNDKFSEENQKVLQGVMNDEQDKVLKAGLKKLGIDNITPGIKLAANYVGATGVLWVIEEGQKDPNITVAQALQKRDPKHRDPTEGNTINLDLATTKAKDFVAKKEKFVYETALKKGLVTPMANENNTGATVAAKSSENADAKNDAKNAQSRVTNNVVVQSQQNTKSTPTQNKKEDDRPAYMKKVTQ